MSFNDEEGSVGLIVSDDVQQHTHLHALGLTKLHQIESQSGLCLNGSLLFNIDKKIPEIALLIYKRSFNNNKKLCCSQKVNP